MTIDIDKDKLKRKVFLSGHFWTQEDTKNVQQHDLPKLDLNHRLVKEAVASWQGFDFNFDAYSLILRLRRIIADGDVGPVTAIMLETPRCIMPDIAPPVGASFDYGNPDINAAVESYQEFAQYTGGSGSWPKCDPERPDVHSTVVNLNTANASEHQKKILKESTQYVERCEAEFGQAVRHVFDGDPKKAHHDVRFEYIAGGVIGYAYFPKPNTCNQLVQCRIDNSYNPNSITFGNLLEHEYKGHSDGLEHTRGGIMNPSILVINPMTWKGDPHEGTKRKYYGGKPIPSKDGPVDPPTPPNEPEYNGVFVYKGQTFKIKVF